MTTPPGAHDREMAAVRARNSAACVEVLRERGRATLAELAAATTLSRPTVEKILTDLQEAGVVTPDDVVTGSGAGRPARRFAFVPGAAYLAGVDLGLDTARALLCDLSGAVVASVDRRIDPGIDGIGRLRAVPELVGLLTSQAQVHPQQVRGVTVAVSGIVDELGRMTQSDLVPEWTGVDLAGRLSRMLSCPVAVENDVKVAAVAEHHTGAAQLVDDVVFVKVDRFVSAAIILGGRLHAGRRSAAGEIGALEAAGQETAMASDEVLVEDRLAMVARAEAGDSVADVELTEYTRRLARSIGLVALTVDPDLVVLGGGVSAVGEPLLSRVRQQLGALAGRTFLPTMTTSTLGGRGVAVGALVRALERASATVYGNPAVTAPPLRVSGRSDDFAAALSALAPGVHGRAPFEPAHTRS
ncbi:MULTISPECIES: ROK family protein [unclassified Isoptericola]|uniref:ROK family protein n=1 Tax=unclassified Isoptericola TaxID=2623355 RepID=UPI00364D6A94